ncbi:hypothetical protein ACFV7R_40525 [Streptomyces sp. NPDC059866]|uniref:hypothetical protein n=1 Tax=Streptomyces sp. NPDC059866 TaxID=3346978 RepID=UPI003664B819
MRTRTRSSAVHRHLFTTPAERRGIALDEDEITLVTAGWKTAEQLDADGLAVLILRGPCHAGTRSVYGPVSFVTGSGGS